eukprot:5190007-Ditylum_brightwellii.AAC.1
MVLNAILGLFASDRQLLETRGSLIVRKLCVLLNAKSVYIQMANTLASYEASATFNMDGRESHGTSTVSGASSNGIDNMMGGGDLSSVFTLEFIGTMVQTLNLILLTAAELHGLRVLLAKSFVNPSKENRSSHGSQLSKQTVGTQQ